MGVDGLGIGSVGPERGRRYSMCKCVGVERVLD